MLFKKINKCGSHLSGSSFECSVNNHVILNTQFGISLRGCIIDESFTEIEYTQQRAGLL